MRDRSPDRKYKLFLQSAFMECKKKQQKGDRPFVLSHEISDRFPYWFSFMQWAMAESLFHADGANKYYPDASVENLTVSEFSNHIWNRLSDE